MHTVSTNLSNCCCLCRKWVPGIPCEQNGHICVSRKKDDNSVFNCFFLSKEVQRQTSFAGAAIIQSLSSLEEAGLGDERTEPAGGSGVDRNPSAT